MYRYSKRSLNNLEGVREELKQFFLEAIKIVPYDIILTHGVRTAVEQNKLYQQGRTTPGIKVTPLDGYKGISNHQIKEDGLGYAVDIAILLNNKVTWVEKYYNELAESLRPLMKKYNVEWGGDWKRKDRPHFEYKGGVK